MHFKRHLAAATALALGLAAVAGSALAAPPSTPPGQEKKAEAAATPAPAAAPAEDAKSEKKAEKAETKSTGINSTESGVKPSNSTKKHTSCETGGSMPTPSCTATTPGSVSTSSTSDHSKRYGNGTTAAQIAVSRDAPAGTEIRGPGNSQPHKVCGKNGNWVDVHAVKSYVGVCTETSSTTTQTSSSTSSTTSASTSTSVTGTAAVAGQTGGSTAAGGVAGSTPAAGGVAGAQGVAGGVGGEAGGVAGAFAQIGGVAAGTLPFTGLPLWAIVLIALAAVAIGVTLVRRSRPLTTRDVV